MNNPLKQIINEILAAVSFLTRCPVPKSIDYNEKIVAVASRWFGLVGLLIGMVGAGIYSALSQFLPTELTAVVTLVLLIRFTGAFHEDGLADLADGFGGGWDKDRKLAIMKDSQIGAYGVLALIASFAIKLMALQSLSTALAILAIITAHAASRGLSGLIPVFLFYVRIGENKTPQKSASMNKTTVLLLTLFGLAPLIFLPIKLTVALAVIWALSFAYMVRIMKNNIGGYTGDTLGATQQVIEVMTYMTFSSLFHLVLI